MAARILCVDDDQDICRLLETILTMCGYRTLLASSARQAMLEARLRPDLIILDVNLPDLDGIEVCRRLRRAGDRVPVLFVTAATGARRAEALAAGGSAFLEKPFDVDELLLVTESLLARGKERRAGGDRRGGDGAHIGPERRIHERRAALRSAFAHVAASNPPADSPFGHAAECRTIAPPPFERDSRQADFRACHREG